MEINANKLSALITRIGKSATKGDSHCKQLNIAAAELGFGSWDALIAADAVSVFPKEVPAGPVAFPLVQLYGLGIDEDLLVATWMLHSATVGRNPCEGDPEHYSYSDGAQNCMSPVSREFAAMMCRSCESERMETPENALFYMEPSEECFGLDSLAEAVTAVHPNEPHVAAIRVESYRLETWFSGKHCGTDKLEQDMLEQLPYLQKLRERCVAFRKEMDDAHTACESFPINSGYVQALINAYAKAVTPEELRAMGWFYLIQGLSPATAVERVEQDFDPCALFREVYKLYL